MTAQIFGQFSSYFGNMRYFASALKDAQNTLRANPNDPEKQQELGFLAKMLEQAMTISGNIAGSHVGGLKNSFGALMRAYA